MYGSFERSFLILELKSHMGALWVLGLGRSKFGVLCG